jgi:4,5-dihydroxyphthalate decarboxylase
MVVTTDFSKSNPDAVREVFRMLAESKRKAGLPAPGAVDFLPFGFEACRAALSAIIRYAAQQKLIPREMAVDELFDATTRSLKP